MRTYNRSQPEACIDKTYREADVDGLTEDVNLLTLCDIALAGEECVVIEGVEVVAVDGDEQYPCDECVLPVAGIFLQDIIEIRRSRRQQQRKDRQCHPPVETLHGDERAFEQAVVHLRIGADMRDAVLLQRLDAGEDITDIAGKRGAEAEIEQKHEAGDDLEDIPNSHRFCRHLIQDERQQKHTGTYHEGGTDIAPRNLALADMFDFFCQLLIESLVPLGETA